MLLLVFSRWHSNFLEGHFIFPKSHLALQSLGIQILSYNVWKHEQYPVLISHQPEVMPPAAGTANLGSTSSFCHRTGYEDKLQSWRFRANLKIIYVTNLKILRTNYWDKTQNCVSVQSSKFLTSCSMQPFSLFNGALIFTGYLMPKPSL